jgi:hypothetical protein
MGAQQTKSNECEIMFEFTKELHNVALSEDAPPCMSMLYARMIIQHDYLCPTTNIGESYAAWFDYQGVHGSLLDIGSLSLYDQKRIQASVKQHESKESRLFEEAEKKHYPLPSFNYHGETSFRTSWYDYFLG